MSHAAPILWVLYLICCIFGHKWEHIAGGLWQCRRCMSRIEVPKGAIPTPWAGS